MGLLLVALASAAALGLTAACGIAFNITTTQVRMSHSNYMWHMNITGFPFPCTGSWIG